jgi:uncharacterized membrane protein
MSETLYGNDRKQYRIELILALLVIGLVCAADLSNLLLASNDFYPLTSDAMGHMGKVQFIAESLSRGEFTSWFPYWYDGATVTQYYPPLSYWVMAPIFMLTKNVMLTYKINCILVNFVGGMGVWYFCRSNIGRWCGLFGGVVYCLQPFNLRVLLSAGMLAQGPIIALLPWYLVIFLRFGQKQSARNFLISTVFCALMILSHANTAFMVCILIMAVAFVFVLMRKISTPYYLFMLFSLIFAGILTAFWSIVGVTHLENPTLPYMSPELHVIYSADLSWFLSLSSSWFHFAIPVSVGSVLALLLYAYRRSMKKADAKENYYIQYCIILTVVTILFSFGLNLPFFQYIPMVNYFLAARALVLASATGAVLSAYLLMQIINLKYCKKTSVKALAILLGVSTTGAAIYYMNPMEIEYPMIHENTFDKMLAGNDKLDDSNFQKGRYAYNGVVDSSETYFPLQNDFNLTDGWNIEGTPQNQKIWNYIIANSSENQDYIAKCFAFDNVRYMLLGSKYEKVGGEINKKYHFNLTSERGTDRFYASEDPSSYFLTDKRNALVLGAGSPGVAVEFPYLVWDDRNDLKDYSLQELERYKLIYLCEPSVDTIQERDNLEARIKNLVNKGIHVIIEPVTTTGYPLFNVTTAEILREKNPIILKETKSKITGSVDRIGVEKDLLSYRILLGLNDSYYKLVQNSGRLKNDIIGTKKVGNGEVVFIGMHLSQYLKGVYSRNRGVPIDEVFPGYCDEVGVLFDDIFSSFGVNKNYWPDPFPVKKADWNYKGVAFEYSSPRPQEITISVTYTPRWKVR